MPRQPVACRTGCNWSLAVRSILSNGGNRNLCLVATYLQVQSSCGLFRVAQLDFQTLCVFLTIFRVTYRSTSIPTSFVMCYVTLSDSVRVSEHIPVELHLHYLRFASLR